jgi:putative iron-dependent peroxidase
MGKPQQGILQPAGKLARFMVFTLRDDKFLRRALVSLKALADQRNTVVGIGQSLALAMGAKVAGLRTFPEYAGKGFDVPSTPYALWVWLQGDDEGDLLHRGRRLADKLAPTFQCERSVHGFTHAEGRDLTGYVDGTENPTGEKGRAAGILDGAGETLDGSSFVAVQQWVHDFGRFDDLSQGEQDNSIGRKKSNNEEIDDAPASAHVKKTAQEQFSPPAFLLRRSMPWSEGEESGLMFIAFGRSFDAFDTQMRSMVGLDDGIPDALFRFTRPITGAYFWCPPIMGDRLDLELLGI